MKLIITALLLISSNCYAHDYYFNVYDEINYHERQYNRMRQQEIKEEQRELKWEREQERINRYYRNQCNYGNECYRY